MPNTRDIRRRIKSVKNTAQITKAMQMVAASKMRKAQQLALSGRPFASLLNKVLVGLRKGSEHGIHPLLEEREVDSELVIVVSTDKGLCGGLNTNLLREAAKFDQQKTLFVAAGRKGLQYLSRTRRQVLADFALSDPPTFNESKRISRYCIELFLQEDVDRITVLYTNFVNTLTQQPVACTLLPISSLEVTGATATAEKESMQGIDYLFEPNAADVLGAILPYYVHQELYQMVLNARASEHSARMVAMKNATDNANNLIKDLTLEYNKLRQAGITTELLEISTAQMALG